jgi:hypothetical protein
MSYNSGKQSNNVKEIMIDNTNRIEESNWLNRYLHWLEREPVLPPLALSDLNLILANTHRSNKAQVIAAALRLADLEADEQQDWFKRACEYAQTIKLDTLEQWYFAEKWRRNLVPIVLAIVHYDFFREEFGPRQYPSEVWVELIDDEYVRRYVSA